MSEHNQDHRLGRAKRFHKMKQSDRDLLQLRRTHEEMGTKYSNWKGRPEKGQGTGGISTIDSGLLCLHRVFNPRLETVGCTLPFKKKCVGWWFECVESLGNCLQSKAITLCWTHGGGVAHVEAINIRGTEPKNTYTKCP